MRVWKEKRKDALCKMIAALALSTVFWGQNSACFFLAHQDEVPEEAKKYRRF